MFALLPNFGVSSHCFNFTSVAENPNCCMSLLSSYTHHKETDYSSESQTRVNLLKRFDKFKFKNIFCFDGLPRVKVVVNLLQIAFVDLWNCDQINSCIFYTQVSDH